MHYETTQIYKRALELVLLGQKVITSLPSGMGFLGDQLRRATSSIVLNFAKGYGKHTLAEQRRFFRIAKASAYEVYAIFDVAHCFGNISPELHAKGTDASDHLAAMLTRFRR